jgi:3-hydroxyisobutyrate dehydrogenase-like beta-hydroxyacid dehydrogenase
VARRVAEGLQAKGIHMIDAPVSGGVIAVEKRTLAIMAGGDKAVLDRHLPVLQCLGDNIIHVGELGAGCVAKLINNMVAFCNMAAGAEGLMLGALAGVNMDTLNQVIRNSSGNSLGYRYVAQKSMSGDYKPTFTTDLAYKDMHLALELADELGMPLALSPQVHNLMRMVRGLGEGGSDVTAMMRVYEHVLGRTVRD